MELFLINLEDKAVIFSIGFFLSLAIYHLFIFFGRTKEYGNLAYAIFNVSFLIAFIIIKYVNFDNMVGKILFLIAAYLATGSLSNYIQYVFQIKNFKYKKLLNNYYNIAAVYLLILILLSIVLKRNDFLFVLFFPALIIYGVFAYVILFKIFINSKLYKIFSNCLVMISCTIVIIHCVYASILYSIYLKPSVYFIMLTFIANSLIFANALSNTLRLEYNILFELKNNLENKVEERTQEIQNLIEQKTIMFINLAHETKTPLTLMKSSIESYINKVKPNIDLETLKNNIDKLCYDIANYLNVERIGKGKDLFYNHNQILDISDFLKKKIALSSDAAKKKEIQLLSDVEDEIHIIADPDAIDQLLNNLIENAIKYTEHGSIDIELKKKNNLIILKVRDTGIGITEEHIKNIFSPYYQVSHPKKNIQGMGMGLTITKKIVDELKGEIKVESKLNEGSVFTVLLPLYKLKSDDALTKNYELTTPLLPTRNIELEEPAYNLEKNTVLIIEDNLELLSHMLNALKDKYNVFYATNGTKALLKLNILSKPHLILCDIMMDEMDGYEFYDKLKTIDDYKDIPLIFITAKTTDKDKLIGLGKGAISYIYKPFSIEEMILKVDNLFRNIELQKESNIREFEEKVSTLIRKKEKIDGSVKIEEICKKFRITQREKEIINLILKAYLQKQIADSLKISLSTVQKHLTHIYAKCKVQTEKELINLFNS